MKTNEKKNTSAKKKLIPAVAMLTTSAVMLSTATYAWFTLNREVEVKGLQMSATASNSLEISLGDLSTGDGAATIGAVMMYREMSGRNKKQMIKKGKQFAKKMGILS